MCWSLWTVGDKEVLERVQRRAVGMVTNWRGRTYEARLAEVGMTTLEDRRARGDMIATYKVLSGKDRVEPSLLFGLPENGTGLQTRRAAGVHPIRTQLVKPKLDIRRNSFSQRVVTPWNALPARVKGVLTVEGFKVGTTSGSEEGGWELDAWWAVSDQYSSTPDQGIEVSRNAATAALGKILL